MSVFAAICILAAVGLLGWSMWKDQKRGGGGMDRALLRAVKGDKALANRLLDGARFKYPGKSDRWYVEKVIYDMQRDGAGR
jgi:hypothetical protein